jgi:hypothetical protein
MRTRRQFMPCVDRLPYRITPGDVSTIQALVPPPTDGSGSTDGSCANPNTVAQPTPPVSSGSGI